MLPPFNPEATCPKCGHDKINCQWHDRNQRGFSPPAHEWLSRRCERCGYIWDEACLNAEDQG
jgi:DNA-directed RNA polymerase subunit M/transcription elongation factor TFIIS